MKTMPIHAALGLSALLFFTAPLSADEDALSLDAEQLNARVMELEAQVEALKDQLAKARAEIEDLTGEKRQLEQLAGVTAKGQAVDSKIALFHSAYDEDNDQTTVTSKPERIKEASVTTFGEFRFYTRYTYPGAEMTAPPAATELCLLAINYPTDRLKHTKTVQVIVDQETIELPVAGFKQLAKRKSAGGSKSSVGGARSFDLQLTFELDPDTLRRIGIARSMRLELPNLTLTLDEGQIATFAAVHKRVQMGM